MVPRPHTRLALPALALVAATALAEPLTFHDAVATALTQHPAARAAQATVATAQARLEQTRAASLPQLSVGLTHVWVGATTAQLSSTLGTATLTVPVLEPRAWADWAEASEAVEVSQLDAATVRRRVALTAGRAWVAVRSQHHALEARLEAQRTAEAHVAFTHGRLEGGAANRLDALRAQRELATVCALVEQAKASLTRAQEVLGVTLGTAAAVDVDDTNLAELAAEDWPAQPGATRPDVLREQVAAHAARAEVEHALADYLPTVALHGQAFAQDVPTPTLPVSGPGWLAQVVVSLPLYDGGRRYGQQHERAAALQRAMARFDEQAQLASAETRTGTDALAHARATLRYAHQATTLAHDALDLTQRRYHEGVGTDLDVIDALREARDADLAVAAAEDQLNLAALDVLAASGRLF